MEKKHKSAKKKLLIIIITISVTMVILLAAALFIDALQSKKKGEFTVDYKFHTPDFEENIFEDEEYLSLTSPGFMKYQDVNTNITLGITRENAAEQNAELAFIVEMLYDIIEGKHEEYNACFSDEYYKTQTPKEAFTMQKIYDVTISYISEQPAEDGNYTKYFYSIEYKILNNNGTFRKDIGDGSKKQYITLSNRQGNLLIDVLNTQIVKYQ